MGRKPKCTLEEFKDIVKHSIKSDMRGEVEYRPYLLEGPAGIGKTSSIYQLVEELTEETGVEFGLYEFDAATRTANDLWGIPYPEDKDGEKVLTWIKDKEFPRDNSPDFPSHGIFFCTELTSVQDEQLKVGLLDLLSNGRMTGYDLPENWYIVADGNGKRDGNVYSTLSFPIRNRMGILEAEFSKEVWLNWCRKSGIHETVISFIDMLPTVDSFLTYDPDLEDLSDGAGEDNYVCATPRSWHAVSDKINMYETSDGGMTPRHLQLVIQSCVGEDVGGEFFVYYMNYSRESDRLIPSIITTEWKNGEPTEDLPQITKEIEEALMSVVSTGDDSDTTYKALYYLSEYGNNLEATLGIIVGGKGEQFRKSFIEHAIKNGNIGILTRIVSMDSSTPDSGTVNMDNQPPALDWD